MIREARLGLPARRRRTRLASPTPDVTAPSAALPLAAQLELVYAELARYGWEPVAPPPPITAPDSVLRARLAEEEARLRAAIEAAP
jgi:hypothetical protein